MIRDPSSHGRRRHTAVAPQTGVRSTKIVDGTDQVHSMLQRQGTACQRPAAARQRSQALTKGRVEPLDVRRVDDPDALRAAPECLDTRGRASNNTAGYLDHTPLDISLHDLRNTEVTPGAQPRAPRCSPMHRVAKGRADGPDVGTQAIRTEQERTVGSTAADLLD